jgi:hypothetical protein
MKEIAPALCEQGAGVWSAGLPAHVAPSTRTTNERKLKELSAEDYMFLPILRIRKIITK